MDTQPPRWTFGMDGVARLIGYDAEGDPIRPTPTAEQLAELDALLLDKTPDVQRANRAHVERDPTPAEVLAGQSELCQDAKRHDAARRAQARRASERVTATPGQGGATVYTTSLFE
jgi:hypothetical protein